MTKIKILVNGYPKGKRKPVMKWLETELPTLLNEENAKDLAIHWAMYKQKELGWRDSKTIAFGEFGYEERNGFILENLLPSKQIQL